MIADALKTEIGIASRTAPLDATWILLVRPAAAGASQGSYSSRTVAGSTFEAVRP